MQIAAVGYCRGELQGQADRTAMRVGDVIAKRANVSLAELASISEKIRLGQWDMARRQFRPGAMGVNAVEVIAEGAGGSTRAVAAVRPRDIVFVVDLSAGMTAGTREALAPILRLGVEDPAYPEVGGLRQLYADLGYETYPGRLEPFGEPWKKGDASMAYETLISEEGPLADLATDDRYRIEPGAPIAQRRRKAFQAVIDQQVLRVMPQATPRPDAAENYDYWAEYLDDVLESEDGPQIGYATYIRFMLERGRIIRAGGQHVALSQYSGDCPWNPDRVAGVVQRFPPQTQPMHSVRREMVAVLQVVALRNLAMAEPARDRVAIVTFDSLTPEGAWVEQALTSDYLSVSMKSARFQAIGERAQATTGMEALELAESLLRRSHRESVRGRDASQLVVFVTAELMEGDGALHGQIAKMAQLGQTVRVIAAGRSDGEAGFMAAVVPTSVVLVE